MGYLGYLSVVLTALVLTGNSGNTSLGLASQLILANIPFLIEFLLRIRKAYKQLKAQQKAWAAVVELGKEMEKKDDENAPD